MRMEHTQDNRHKSQTHKRYTAQNLTFIKIHHLPHCKLKMKVTPKNIRFANHYIRRAINPRVYGITHVNVVDTAV